MTIFTNITHLYFLRLPPEGGEAGAVLAYIGYIGMCGPKGIFFSYDCLKRSRVGFLHSSLELGMCFRRRFVFIIFDKTIKTLNNVFNIGLN